ncbi:MAG: PAAR domain-containing protein [Iodobacter sp.]
MRGAIRLNDKTSHGGAVISVSSSSKVDGVLLALVGDWVSCPQTGHGVTQILPGEGSFMSDGKQVALDGFHAGCGCTLISSSAGLGA